MSAIVIIDTSVLLNIMDVPDRNQRKDEVLDRLAVLIEDGDHLFIPMAAIVEVGNHIAQVKNGAHRRSAAGRFVQQLRSALNDEAPWKPINFPSNQRTCWDGWMRSRMRPPRASAWAICRSRRSGRSFAGGTP